MIPIIFAAVVILSPPQETYSARCLIEVAEMTGQAEYARTAEGRELIRLKAAELDASYDRIAIGSDTVWRLANEYEAEQRDLFENGLITAEEWADVQAVVATHRATVRADLSSISAPSCGFLDSHRGLPVFAALDGEAD